MKDYDFEAVENKWKEAWFGQNLYRAVDFSAKPKKYILAELPYPSGYALHAGHMMRYTVPEIYSRYLRMRGYNVLFPMGWDAFGLPSETFAIKTGIHPAETTRKSIENFKDSLKRMGYAIDWDREINTSSPEYYKWTQWIFLKLWKAGLAEYKEMPVWWCAELGVLADEEVLTDKDGNKISERGGYPVIKKPMRQWVLKIPTYAEKLLAGLKQVDYMESIKTAQINWIGRSEGAAIDFETNIGAIIRVFTTRPDTLYGVTFMAISPENPIIAALLERSSNRHKAEEYIRKASSRSDLERQAAKEKTGVQMDGVYAIHPLDPQRKIPIFIADYVLMGYGTGAIMGVPAHDERDFEFAKQHKVDIVHVIQPRSMQEEAETYTGEGTMVNSGPYDGMASEEFCKMIVERLEQEGKGQAQVQYKLRDQVFSRQRYWGEPIPLLHVEGGGVEPVVDPDDPEEANQVLPVTLPPVPDYRPTKDGSSPLARNVEWVETVDSRGRPAARETDTMPNWAGSNWYYLRYLDPKNDHEFANREKLDYWMPVDRYFGGSEHTTMHLLYSRFWYKFLYDQGLVSTDEPYMWRLNGGILLGPDGRKMSKSFGNIVDPMDVIRRYGADATRMYVCFIGPYEDTYPWNENGIRATYRLVNTIYDLRKRVRGKSADEHIERAYHRLVQRVSSMLENIKMNTAVSEIMIFSNELKRAEAIDQEIWRGFLKVIAPFAPFIAEELWQESHGYKEFKAENSIHLQKWPEYNPELAREEVLRIPVQVNGKVREQVEISGEEDEADVQAAVYALPKVAGLMEGKEVVRFMYVPKKIVSIVVK